MRVDNQNTSLHYFNSYAVKDRVPCSSRHASAKGASCYNIDSAKIPEDLKNTPYTTFLPSVEDCKNLRDNYIHIIARVLVENFTFLKPFKACIPSLKHKYSDHMAKKSEIVSPPPHACMHTHTHTHTHTQSPTPHTTTISISLSSLSGIHVHTQTHSSQCVIHSCPLFSLIIL